MWRYLGGRLHWPSFEILCDVLDVADPESLAAQLLALSEALRDQET